MNAAQLKTLEPARKACGSLRVRIEGVDRASGAITAAGVDWPHSSR